MEAFLTFCSDLHFDVLLAAGPPPSARGGGPARGGSLPQREPDMSVWTFAVWCVCVVQIAQMLGVELCKRGPHVAAAA